jgi:hypothetical protein
VPVPAELTTLVGHEGNNEILVRFLSQQLILQVPAESHCCSNWSNSDRLESSYPSLALESLEGCHADTRTNTYCVKTKTANIVISARDRHSRQGDCFTSSYGQSLLVWMKAGTAKKRKFIKIHAIVEHL